MLSRASNSRRVQGAVLALVMVLLGSIVPPTASAQYSSMPSQLYFNTLPLYHDGEYRAALNAFLAEGRSGLKTPAGSWIDAIPYFTMAGESYYQLGQLQNALDSYEAALKLYVAYSDWMLRVQFPLVINPAPAGPRATPWGQSKRNPRIGQFPDTFTMGQGLIDNSAAVFRGGVVQQAVLFPMNAAEIVRCTSLAIRRRRELMGPVCKHDPLTSNVLDVLARKPGPPNHWAQAWVNVQLGCAYAAAGNTAQAVTTLQQSLLAGGEYDHPLTSTALVELGRLSLEAGDYPAAGRYFEEATYASASYPNLGNLEEAFRLGFLAHLMLNQRAPYPLLAPAIAWSKSQGFRHLQASLLLMAAEDMAVLGETGQAVNWLTTARATVGRNDLAIGQWSARLNYLTALTSYQAGNHAAGDQALDQALTFQRTGSLWLYQMALADNRYMAGELSDRVGMQLYDAILRDPTPTDWTSNPLECLSTLCTPHGAVLEHWFETALKNSKEQELALEISDRVRRHRFFSTLPMGGRLLALRWLLEGPPDRLDERALLERQDLLARFPKFQQLSLQATKIRAQLAGNPLVEEGAGARVEQATKLASLAEISQAQEAMLREMAVRRLPAEMTFPPLRKTRDVQQGLPDGQVLLAFFATSRNLHAFLYSKDKYATWQIQSPAMLYKQIGILLRDLGNFDSNHEISPADLAKGNWRISAAKVMNQLLDRSNVDLAGNFDEIVIVPDGALWYLPFEALSVGKKDQAKNLISQARVRYAPTVGLAVPTPRAHKPRPNVGVVLGKLHPQDDAGVTAAAFEQLGPAIPGSVALPKALPATSSIYRMLLDELIVLDDIEAGDGPYEWSPGQLDRGKTGSALSGWLTLPWGGPEHVILPGFHTAAETGLRRGNASGEDMFLSLCGLLSSGTRTVLISRWRPAGQTSFDLVREFAQELPHASAAEAWQRSVQMAQATPIEPDREPRFKKTTSHTDPPNASHPFFWSAYMLVDCGTLPEGQANPDGVGKVGPKPQPANPRVQPVPSPPGAAVDPGDDPAGGDAPAPTKRGKKPKAPPRVPKKSSVRSKPAA